ncbi:MAG TPA: hypothetical protein VEL76_04505 [Gemmataceae bacterium]|nr:hypothetical protein [Gemmataceae bacterium]
MMDEREWLKATHPHAMIDYLRGNGQASPRKLRLFAVECCRRIWHLLTDERSWRAVEVAERYADGLVSNAERIRAQRGAAQFAAASSRLTVQGRLRRGIHSAEWSAADTAERAATATRRIPEECRATAAMATRAVDLSDGRANSDEAGRQAELLRDVFGPLPFRPVPIEPSWRTSAVMALATSIYDERRFEDMPILADALEEAGCAPKEILQHLRQREPIHIRGCWCLDRLLNKE